jgi:hypothetical protein
VIRRGVLKLLEGDPSITTNGAINAINLMDLAHALKRYYYLALGCCGSAAETCAPARGDNRDLLLSAEPNDFSYFVG